MPALQRMGVLWLLMGTIWLVPARGQQVTGLTEWDIFLDPGHSQTENMGIYGYSEAEKNLRVGLQLRDLLLSTTDIDTVFICRTNDSQIVPLTQRDDLANNAWGPGQPASWFHSIHSNAPSTTSNSVLLLWGQHYTGAPYYGEEKDPPGGHAMSDIMAPLLAKGMRTSPWTSIGDCSFYTWSDWCKTSGGPYLHVNRTTAMPSELSESGFHTNPVQNQRNMSDSWKRLEAYTFYWSILQFHSIPRPPVSILTGIIYDVESGIPINGAVAAAGGLTDTTDTWESLFHKYSTDSTQLHNGFYFLEDVPGDNVELVISATGYYPDTMQVAMVDTFFTFRDAHLVSSVPPTVASSTPVQGDTAFAAWDPIVITFSRPMNPASVETTLVVMPDSVAGTFVWANGYRQLTFTPDSTLACLTPYTLAISGQARDVYDHPFDGNGDGTGGDDYVLAFTTGPEDMFPPAITTFYPVYGLGGVELRPVISVSYDEPIDPASIEDGQLTLKRYLDSYFVPGQMRHYAVGAQSVLTFFPTEPLAPLNLHILTIAPGLRDFQGNEQTAQKALRFTTGDLVYEPTAIDNFDAGVDNWWQPSGSGSTTGVTASREANQTVVNLLTGSTQSLKLSYTWDTAASSWLIREYLSGGAPRNVHFNSSFIMQAYVFGDGSGNQLRFAVDDDPSFGGHEVSPWYTIDWVGWRLVSWDMTNDGAGTWIGDGNLDGTLRFDSIQLTHVPGAAVYGALYFDDLRLVQTRPVAIAEVRDRLPERFALHPNYPNPFNPTTTIAYEVPRTAHVRLTVYNLLGRPVRTLVRGMVEPGHCQVVWDGKDRHGRSVASGIYIVRLEVEGFAQSRKLVLAR